MTPFQFLDAARAFDAYKPYSVTSYKRTDQHNDDVGGHKISGHLVWLALDADYDKTVSADEIDGLEKVSRGLKLLWKLSASRVSFHLEPLDYP